MSHSTSQVTYVLTYNFVKDTAEWRITSLANKFILMDMMTEEIIDETDANYEVIAKMAGPKPVTYVQGTDDSYVD